MSRKKKFKVVVKNEDDCNGTVDDEFEKFAMCLAEKLRQLPIEKAKKVQLKIDELIYNTQLSILRKSWVMCNKNYGL